MVRNSTTMNRSATAAFENHGNLRPRAVPAESREREGGRERFRMK